MRGMAEIPYGLSRTVAFLLLLSMLCDCGPRTLNRAVRGSQEKSDPQDVRGDPQEYVVEGYGAIRVYRESLPPCFYDTVATVVTNELESQEAATAALLDLVMRHGGRAVLGFEAETLVVKSTEVRSHDRLTLTDPIYDENGRIIGRTQVSAVVVPAEQSLGVKYKYRGIVVRYRDGDCGS